MKASTFWTIIAVLVVAYFYFTMSKSPAPTEPEVTAPKTIETIPNTDILSPKG